MEKQYDAVIAGYTCVDFIPDFGKHPSVQKLSSILSPGKLVEIEGMDFVLGGVVPNTGLIMNKFGKKVFLNGLIGNDFVGELANTQLKQSGVSEGMITTREAGTGFSIIIAPPGIDRIFLESPGCNHTFGMEHIDFEAVSKSRLFHFGYPPLLKQFFLDNGNQLAQMYSRVQKMGVVTSLDFSLPDPESESGKANWAEILEKTLPNVDIFTPSLEELFQTMVPKKYTELLYNSGTSFNNGEISVELIRDVGKRIIDMGVKILLIKMGSQGAYLITRDVSAISKKTGSSMKIEKWSKKEMWCSVYQVDSSKIKHASGAGDTAVAAFLSAILDGENPDMALKYAAMAGRDSLYCEDIFKDMSNWEKLSMEIKSESIGFIREY
jgi:sugar/nucleoside kinase (ribokinase family)